MQESASSPRARLPTSPDKEEGEGGEDNEQREGEQRETGREEERDTEERDREESQAGEGKQWGTSANVEADERAEEEISSFERRCGGTARVQPGDRGEHEPAELVNRRALPRDAPKRKAKGKKSIWGEIRAYGSVEIHRESYTPEEGAVLAGLQSREGEEEMQYGPLRRAGSCPDLDSASRVSRFGESTEDESSSEEEEQGRRGAGQLKKECMQAQPRRQAFGLSGQERRGRSRRRTGDARDEGLTSREEEGAETRGSASSTDQEAAEAGEKEDGGENGEEEEEGEQIWDLWGGEGPSEEDLHLLELLVGKGVQESRSEKSEKRSKSEEKAGEGESLGGLRQGNATDGEDEHRKSPSSSKPLATSSETVSDELDDLLLRAAAGDIQDEVFAIKKKTLVLSFGKNSYGQLGFPLKHHSAPVVVELPTLRAQQLLSASASSSSSPRSPFSPSCGASLQALEKPATVSRVFCGRFHSAALTEGGSVLLWGHNASGQLGRGGFPEDEEEDSSLDAESCKGVSGRPERRARFEVAPQHSRRTPRRHNGRKEERQEEASGVRGTDSTTAEGSPLNDAFAFSVSSTWSAAGSSAAPSASSALSSPATRSPSSKAGLTAPGETGLCGRGEASGRTATGGGDLLLVPSEPCGTSTLVPVQNGSSETVLRGRATSEDEGAQTREEENEKRGEQEEEHRRGEKGENGRENKEDRKEEKQEKKDEKEEKKDEKEEKKDEEEEKKDEKEEGRREDKDQERGEERKEEVGEREGEERGEEKKGGRREKDEVEEGAVNLSRAPAPKAAVKDFTALETLTVPWQEKHEKKDTSENVLDIEGEAPNSVHPGLAELVNSSVGEKTNESSSVAFEENPSINEAAGSYPSSRYRRSSSCPPAGLADALLGFNQNSAFPPSPSVASPLASSLSSSSSPSSSSSSPSSSSFPSSSASSSSVQTSSESYRTPWYKRLFGTRKESSSRVSGERGEKENSRENRGEASSQSRAESAARSSAGARPSPDRGFRQVFDFFTRRGMGRDVSERRSSSSPLSSRRVWEGGPATPQTLASRAAKADQRLQAKRRRPASPEEAFGWKPVLLREFGTVYRVSDVALGGEHSMFLCQDGSLWLCGSNQDGQLGLLAKETRQPISCSGKPRRMPLGDSFMWPEYRKIASPVAFIAAGYKYSALIDAKDRLWMWGNNQFGQCGMDPGAGACVVMLPWRVRFPQKGIAVVQIALGKYHSLCLTEDGQVFVWGRGRFGVLGMGAPKHATNRSWFFSRRRSVEPLFICTPQPLRALCSVHVTRIASGDSHCAAVGVARLPRTAYTEVALLQLREQGAAYRDYVLEEMKKRSAQYTSSTLGPLPGGRALFGVSPAACRPEARRSLPFRSRPVDGFFFSPATRQSVPVRDAGRRVARDRLTARLSLRGPGDRAGLGQLAPRGRLGPSRASWGQRRSLLMLMSPAQRYRARLFHETKRDSWSRHARAETDDELRLSDLERRRRWGFPEGVGEPYGTERGSAAHRGGDQLFLWGKGSEGELGCNTLRNQYTPVELPFVLSSSKPCYIQVHEVALGGDFTLAVAASYSTSFTIHDPVPSPSPRQGAAATRTLLDIYRGKPSASFSAPFSAAPARPLHAERQSFVSWSTDMESRAASPKSSASNGSLRNSESCAAGNALSVLPPREDAASQLAGEGHSLDRGDRTCADRWETISEGVGSEGEDKEERERGEGKTEREERKAAALYMAGRKYAGSQTPEANPQSHEHSDLSLGETSKWCALGPGESEPDVEGKETGGETKREGERTGQTGVARRKEDSLQGVSRREGSTAEERSPGEDEGGNAERKDSPIVEAHRLREETSETLCPGEARDIDPSRSEPRRQQESVFGDSGSEGGASSRGRSNAILEAVVPHSEDALLKHAVHSLPVLSVAPPPNEDALPSSVLELRPSNRTEPRDSCLSSCSLSLASISSKSVSSSPHLTPGSPATSDRGSVTQIVPSFVGRPSVPFFCASSFGDPLPDRLFFSPARTAASRSGLQRLFGPFTDSSRSSTWSRGSIVSSAGCASGREALLSALACATDPLMPLQLYVWGSNRGNQLPLEPEEPQPTFLVPHRVNLLSLVDATVIARRAPSICLFPAERGPCDARRKAPRVASRGFGAGGLRAGARRVGSSDRGGLEETGGDTAESRGEAAVEVGGLQRTEGQRGQEAMAWTAQNETLEKSEGASQAGSVGSSLGGEGKGHGQRGQSSASKDRNCLREEETAEGTRAKASSSAGEEERPVRRRGERGQGETPPGYEGEQSEQKPRRERDSSSVKGTRRRQWPETFTEPEDEESARSNGQTGCPGPVERADHSGREEEATDQTKKERETSQTNVVPQACDRLKRLDARPSDSSSGDESASGEKPASASSKEGREASVLAPPPLVIIPPSSSPSSLEQELKQSVPRAGAQQALLSILSSLDSPRRSVGEKSAAESEKTDADSLCRCSRPRHETCTPQLVANDSVGSEGCSRVEQRDKAIKLRKAASAALSLKLSEARRNCRGSGTPDLLWAFPSLARHARAGGDARAGGEAKSMSRRRKVYCARGGVWRAICSVKVKSVAAGQEHSLLVVEVEYLEAHKTNGADANRSPPPPMPTLNPSGYRKFDA
ncbi:regulator of chromosome condensation (RCC1) repeat-containing protein [Toxoplasma gondii FOU]|uniref:Regulator of chromosome condensation (RCC1) repeat-containing protein n=1 Tax=Toxoplasma gondii FOU TaxID=943167 RepID=A0A086LHR2_TOXGO|nr:regulator of chromosome condensation (RCC1) repeat-containing protein [Toxoplasma gondii FOU]